MIYPGSNAESFKASSGWLLPPLHPTWNLWDFTTGISSFSSTPAVELYQAELSKKSGGWRLHAKPNILCWQNWSLVEVNTLLISCSSWRKEGQELQAKQKSNNFANVCKCSWDLQASTGLYSQKCKATLLQAYVHEFASCSLLPTAQSLDGHSCVWEMVSWKVCSPCQEICENYGIEYKMLLLLDNAPQLILHLKS